MPAHKDEAAAPAGSRRRARELCLRALYRWEVVGDLLEEVTAELDGDERIPEGVRGYAVHLLSLVSTSRAELDAALEEALDRWKLSRLAVTDRCVLRMGAAEMMYAPDVPTAVVLDESIEIAKRYGSPRSGAFVNGVLDRVARNLRSGDDT